MGAKKREEKAGRTLGQIFDGGGGGFVSKPVVLKR